MGVDEAEGDSRNRKPRSGVHTVMDTLIASVAPRAQGPSEPEQVVGEDDAAPEVAASVPSVWHPSLIQVYEERYDDFVRLAYLMTGQSAIAEEVVQDAFIASRRSWDGVRDPAPYVRAAVINRCYSWGRRFKLERERQPPPDDPAELVADEMWDALATLTHRQRAAIVLRFYLDLPDKQIAEILGCRLATVRTAVHRGLRALRKVLEP